MPPAPTARGYGSGAGFQLDLSRCWQPHHRAADCSRSPFPLWSVSDFDQIPWRPQVGVVGHNPLQVDQALLFRVLHRFSAFVYLGWFSGKSVSSRHQRRLTIWFHNKLQASWIRPWPALGIESCHGDSLGSCLDRTGSKFFQKIPVRTQFHFFHWDSMIASKTAFLWCRFRPSPLQQSPALQ